jgi:hypothetical protein
VALTLEQELAQIMAAAAAEATAPATCRRCGLAYPDHNDGGPVRFTVGGWYSPATAIPLSCPGFAWVEPGAPPASYGGAPAPTY